MLSKPSAILSAHTLQLYSRKYYKECCRPIFNKEWAEVKARPLLSDKKQPHPFNICITVIKCLFAAESPEFRAELEKEPLENLQELKEKVKAASDGPINPTDPASQQQSLNQAYSTLQPLVDQVARKYGFVATLLLAGPIPEWSGAVHALCFHSGKTIGLIKQNWQQYNADRFDQATKSLIGFA
ncbi:hypothetical protein BC834DRAFT_971671 [Gloeopeniophorella convolvens]|nr:hypothetical protein BC834DRAFT_971671 [Gloeopeniophorella convolvens]